MNYLHTVGPSGYRDQTYVIIIGLVQQEGIKQGKRKNDKLNNLETSQRMYLRI